ncbi:tubulin-like doman-containing protein [Sphingomonas hengshuiensis]|uniref:Tubulin like n=1 Tax=Sphingomonas hengshuiensis TaxID=1609977 RepID=A0A7U4J9Z8_9SPHN|nr:tubulin-like doman-containing protein [Sphingomonas hengshuiensis]AJP72992.1 hypothetical protein TS85_16115 [Sphingomonas hengshuiensis]
MPDPILFIGLGGTGKQTLLSLRRQMLDHYGTATLPHMSFLCVDTDKNMVDLDGEAFDEFMMEAQFSNTEWVNAPVDNGRLAEFYRQPTQYPHYTAWFDMALERHGFIVDGAAQVRSFGRMAFFQNYETIRSSVLARLQAFRDPRLVARAHELYGEPLGALPLVYVIFSVAGGTGSGMFLDMAFLLKDIAERDQLPSRSSGVCVLPSVFSTDLRSRAYANGYAAMLELEYYNYERRKEQDLNAPPASRDEALFRVMWTREDIAAKPIRTLRGPVFNETWLIDSRPRPLKADPPAFQIGAAQRWALTEMIAEWLFVRHGRRAPALAGMISQEGSNLLAPLQNTVDLPVTGRDNRRLSQTLSCRYGSFGLSKIYVPVAAMAKAASHQLAADIVARWLRKLDMAPQSRAEYRTLTYPRLLLQDDEPASAVVPLYERLQRFDETSSVFDRISSIVTQRCQEALASGATHDFIAATEAWRSDAERKQLSPENGGALVQVIRYNASEAQEEIRAALDIILQESLADERRRFPFARALLEDLSDTFRQLAAYARDQIESFRSEAQKLNREKDRVASYTNARMPAVRIAATEVAFEFIDSSFRASLDRTIYSAMADVYGAMAAHIGEGTTIRRADGSEERVTSGELKRIDGLQYGLERIHRRLGERRDSIVARRTSLLNFRVGHEAVGDFYKTADGLPFDDTAVAEVEKQVYDSGLFDGRKRSPWGLVEALASSGEDDSLKKLLLFTDHKTAHVRDQNVNAIQQFDRTFGGGEGEVRYRAQVLHQAQMGSPWLAEGSTAFSHLWSREQRLARRVARNANPGEGSARATFDRAALNRFDDMLSNEIDHLSRSDGQPHVVYFEAEMAGFPLAAVPHIEQYRNLAYLPHLRGDDTTERAPAKRVLHTELDIEKYTDVAPFSEEEVYRRLTAVELLAKTLVLGIVTPRATPDGLGYEFSYVHVERFEQQERQLGRFNRAITTLAGGGPIVAQLQDRTSQRLTEQPGTGDLARIALLLELMARESSSPIRGSNWRATLRSLVAGWEDKDPGLAAAMQDAHATLSEWTEEMPAGSGFFRLRG